MLTERRKTADIFVKLGEMLSGFGDTVETGKVIERACEENPWFTPREVRSSIDAIREHMLDRKQLEEWLSPYPIIAKCKKVGVIMAGNIPLVGFFDMMCVLISGHSCYMKPSSKDSILMNYAAGLLKRIDTDIPLFTYSDNPIDAVIATGSDNTNRYFRRIFGDIPSVLRGNRSSVAILSGSETLAQLRSLADDIFSYSGLGCRNVCRLFIPEEYDVNALANILSEYKHINPKYVNNFLQHRAVAAMQGLDFVEGARFILRETDEFPAALSEITYTHYTDIGEAHDWVTSNRQALQCIVCDTERMNGPAQGYVDFGMSQRPTLTDYPDNIDVMRFLSGI